MTRTEAPLPSWLRVVLIATIVLGIFFRFVHLDRKVFWFDEAINSIHSSGYSKEEFFEALQELVGQPISIQQLQAYQYPDRDRSAVDVIRVLAEGEPQNPPFYYILAHYWERLLGHSVAVKRSLSAVISLFVFPLIYGLCVELFHSKSVGWIAMALLAVSPFHILFSQEVRIYVLWTVTILLSSWCLLRAIRSDTRLSWGFYSLALSASFYTFPLSLLTAIGHAIYLVAIEGIRMTKNTTRYAAATSASILLFSPWLFLILRINSTQIGDWRKDEIDLFTLVKVWGVHCIQIVVDIFPSYRDLGDGFASLNDLFNPISISIYLCILGLFLYSLYAISTQNISKFIFILALLLIPFLTFSILDLLLGGLRSAVSQYFIPCYLALHLALSFAIAKHMNANNKQIIKSMWSLVLIVILGLGIFSDVVISREQSWWNKRFSYNNIPIAKIVNQSPNPIIVGDLDSWIRYNLLSLSYLLKSNVKIVFIDQTYLRKFTPKVQELVDENYQVFIASPSLKISSRFKSIYGDRFKLVYPYGDFIFWQIDP
jgi:uncharacterized membrane protein